LYVLSIVLLLAVWTLQQSTRDTPRTGAGTRVEPRHTVTTTVERRHDVDTIGGNL
jgi:hypothetical protein